MRVTPGAITILTSHPQPATLTPTPIGAQHDMNVTDFMRKWRESDLTERSGSQQHFCDLCELVEHPKPAGAYA